MLQDAVKIGNVQADPMIPHIIRINKLSWETEDTFTLYLKPNG